jgi:hypothetical protein
MAMRDEDAIELRGFSARGSEHLVLKTDIRRRVEQEHAAVIGYHSD